MVTEIVMDCSLNQDSNGSSASNAGSPRPPTVPATETKTPPPAPPGSGETSASAAAAAAAAAAALAGYHHRSPPSNSQRTPSPAAGGQQQLHAGFQHLPPPPPSQLSPPPLMHQRMHLPPPGLGLFNQLVHHASPLDLMAAAHQHAAAAAAASRDPQQGPPRSYASPPPISSTDPTANECKLVNYRGQKVAAFIINGETMLCLPQAFEMFLKHLVGGLHTVYTKLKRLDIVPLVCNVEQVRILRGLGAIQPGVNRCKLLSCKDFDALYRDCTTARCLTSHRTPDSSRPGRPPKRVPLGLSLAASHLQPGHPQLKKPRMENGDYGHFENGQISEAPRLEKSPLLANGYNQPPTHLHPMHPFYHPGIPHPGSVIKGQGGAGMDAIARSAIWEDCRTAYQDIVKHLERLREEQGEVDAIDQRARDLSALENFSNGHNPVLNLSKGGGGGGGSAGGGSRGSAGTGAEHSDSEAGSAANEDDDADLNSDPDDEDESRHANDTSSRPRSEGRTPSPLCNLTVGVGVAAVGSGAANVATSGAPTLTVGTGKASDPRPTSTEAILRNIEGLLQVAADTARQQERQTSLEKAELKLDVLREREVKESLERRLLDETRTRVLCQKRLKKVRRASRRLQEQLELEMKRRSQLEEVLKTTGASSEALRILTESNSGDSSGSTAAAAAAAAAAANTAPPTDCRDSPKNENDKKWPYSGIDLINPGAFWQNYSESLAQELENERKNKQKQQQQQQQEQHRQQLMQQTDPIEVDMESKPLGQDLRWPTERRAALIS